MICSRHRDGIGLTPGCCDRVHSHIRINVADGRHGLESGVHVDELNFSRIAQICLYKNVERARTDKWVDDAIKLSWMVWVV